MNDIAMKPAPDAGTEVTIIIEPATALSVLTDREQFDAFYAKVKAECDAHVPDLTTAAGRKATASLAYKVARTKTAIDKAGLALTEEARKQIAVVNESRKAIAEKLDSLKDEVRRPLTDWEEADEQRQTDVKAKLTRIESAAVVSIEDTPATVQSRLDDILAIEIADEHFQEYAAPARAQQARTVETLSAAVIRLTKEAEDRAELERLRQADQERQERERLQAEQRAYVEGVISHIRDCGKGCIGGSPQPYGVLFRELHEKVELDERLGDRLQEVTELRDQVLAELTEAFEAEQAEERRKAEEARQQEQREAADRAAREAEERTRQEAEARARAEQEERDRQHQARLEQERAARERAEAETKRLQEEEAARLAKAEEDRKAADARAQDQERRTKVKTEAKVAIMAQGVGEEAARKIVTAIIAGDVPHVALTF